MGDDDERGGYRWETEYERTWEEIHEDEDGLIQSSTKEIAYRAKRKQLLEKKNVRLGMMRHLYVVIDMSEAMLVQDLKPTRHLCTLKLLEGFIEEYFDQNPISQLGIILTRNKRADRLSELAGNPKRHITTLKSAADIKCVGEPSLQNSLECAAQTLKHMPSHTSREVLVILGSLTTCDPSDIFSTIEAMKSYNIRCSVIGLASEVRVCWALAKATKGTYNVILDEVHFKDLLHQHVTPLAAVTNMDSSLIRMGFPHHKGEGEGKPSMCSCHLDSKIPGEGFGTAGYYCPQCCSKYCELPVECKACGLILVSAPHLARSYHHLFPLDSFNEVQEADFPKDEEIYCYSCQATLSIQTIRQCNNCKQYFCLDCDLFIHDSLHICPGCVSTRQNQP